MMGFCDECDGGGFCCLLIVGYFCGFWLWELYFVLCNVMWELGVLYMEIVFFGCFMGMFVVELNCVFMCFVVVGWMIVVECFCGVYLWDG